MSRSFCYVCKPYSFALLLAALYMAGCGEPGPSTMVSGKVTVGGQPVQGTIHFLSADGKEVSGPIGPTGGMYTVANPPVGEVTVLVKGTGLAAAQTDLKAPPGA